MKILSIHFKNINSLRHEHTIDFTRPPLNRAGLFAITGKTGSGKSTLLDVICLALYNQVPRLGEKVTRRLIEATGTILTRNTGEAFAEVVYESHQGAYRSRWSISTNTKGNLRNYEMELSHHPSGELLDLKKSDVPRKNEELVGLSYSQFIRSILLAQGDFARFLQSGRDERGALLEKITGGEIYRRIGQQAYARYKEQAVELEKMKTSEKQIKESLLDDDNYQQAREVHEMIKKQIEEQEQSQRQLEEAIKHKGRIQEARDLYHKSADQEGKARERLKAFDQNHGVRLEDHKNLIPYAEELQQWEQLRNRLEKHTNQKGRHEKAVKNAREKDGQAHEAVESFLGEKMERSRLIPALEERQEQVEKLNQALEHLQQEYRYASENVSNLAGGLDVETDPQDPPQMQANLQEAKSRKQKRKAELEGSLEQEHLADPAQSLEKIKEYTDMVDQWKRAAEWTGHYNHKIGKLKKSIAQKKQQLETLPAEIEKARHKEEALRQELDNIRLKQQNNQLRAKLEDQRQKLQPGQPCPLCGSTQHPYIEEYAPATDDLSGSIGDKQKEHEQALTRLKELQAEKKKLDENLQTEQKDLEEQTQALHLKQQKVQEYRQQLPEKYRDGEPEKLATHLSNSRQQLEEYIRLSGQLQQITDLEPLSEKLNEITQKGKDRRRELNNLYSGKNIRKDIKKLRDQLNQAENELKTAEMNFQQWEKDRQNLEQELTEQQNRLKPMLEQLNYPSIREAKRHLLSSSQYEQLKEERNGISKAITAAQSQKETYEKQHRELKEKDVATTREDLEKQLKQTKQALSILHERRDSLYGKISYQQRQLEELDKLGKRIQQHEEQNEKWRLLNHYIGDREGKNFSTFAQQLTLEQLVQLANQRIARLSERYILDIPGENEDESLVIKDMDMGAQRRSVKTLSGGESFLISLSLALALSDLASRNVEIKSLFIDEGFGSLDQVTLDQTLDTLEKLQAESEKTIGVISHIEALKERMDTQIEIVRNGQGFSSVEVKEKAATS